MKEGSLFVLYIWDSPNQDAPDHVLVSLESSQGGLGSMAFGLVMQKFLNIEWFLHWKLD